MVLKWIKDKAIGDFAEERRKYQAKQDAENEAWRELRTRVFSATAFSVPIVGESHYQDALRYSKDSAKDYSGKATSRQL